MRELAIKPTRTRQFLAQIPGLTMKCLQERLRALEGTGMIVRIKYEERVPRVEHHLTERGKRLLDIFIALRDLQAEITDSDCICPMDLRRNAETADMTIDAIDFECPTRRGSGNMGRESLERMKDTNSISGTTLN